MVGLVLRRSLQEREVKEEKAARSARARTKELRRADLPRPVFNSQSEESTDSSRTVSPQTTEWERLLPFAVLPSSSTLLPRFLSSLETCQRATTSRELLRATCYWLSRVTTNSATSSEEPLLVEENTLPPSTRHSSARESNPLTRNNCSLLNKTKIFVVVRNFPLKCGFSQG